MADCGLRWLAVPTDLERIADRRRRSGGRWGSSRRLAREDRNGTGWRPLRKFPLGQAALAVGIVAVTWG
eukprot:3842977-Alexandrium_andersonii.AAC.1